MEEKTIDFSKRLYVLTAVVVVGLAIFLIGGVMYKFASLPQNYPQEITVSGEGKFYAKPDIATVSLGTRTEGLSVKEITDKNIRLMNAIIDDLKKLGIEEKDIQTTQYSIQPQYNWTEKEGRIPNGYAIDQSVQVKIRNFDNISKVFDIANVRGANTVGSLQFSVDDPSSIQAGAREKAIAEAKNKAKVLAQQAGLKIVKLVSVSEGQNTPSPIMYADSNMAMGSAAKEVSIAPTIQAGQLEASTTVYLTYRVR